MIKYIKGELKLLREIVFGQLGWQNDFVGYETLIEFIDKNKLYNLSGDFLEIGAFMGGGSKKLAKYAGKYGKKLHVIDLFDPDFDPTKNNRGEAMNVIYRKILGQKNLREVFDKNTKDAKNIIVYNEDSKKIQLPADLKICFAFVDGNHDPEYVKNDFNLVWNKTISGGVVAYHDYGGDLPQTTTAIKEMIEKNRATIEKTDLMTEKTIMFITKK